MTRRILSGIQPTGNMHIGNYLGAIVNWVDMQNSGLFESFFCIVDLHAMTTRPHPSELRQAVRETAAAFIASGIDPEKSTIFVQSHCPAHAELNWILACHAQIGWLNRMTQFKEKMGKNRDSAGFGLYAYPVLMAADILAYKATDVPVGEDQKQHIEFCRDLAGAFNQFYETDYFPLPEPHILNTAARIMSLRDGTKKMSKSELSDYSRINLTDDEDTIAQKIRKAKTDSGLLPESIANLKNRPEARNLLEIYATFDKSDLETTTSKFAGQAFSALKSDLEALTIAKLTPIRNRIKDLLAEQGELDALLKKNAERAQSFAHQHLSEIKMLTGLA